MTTPAPPPRPIQMLQRVKPKCTVCGASGHAGPGVPADQWLCPKCLSDADPAVRDWIGVGAGQ